MIYSSEQEYCLQKICFAEESSFMSAIATIVLAAMADLQLEA